MTKDELNDLCQEVYGTEKWASILAADISAVGRQTQPATVNHWQSGERPVAAWVPKTLVVAWHARVERLKQAAVRARIVANRLSATLAPDLDLDEEADLAPRM